jgi:flagella synthesis protein FlgN
MATASPDALLQDEITLVVCLIDLMKQEQQFLVAGNTDGLATLTPLKNQLIEQLAGLGTQRNGRLVEQGLVASETGMAAYVARAADPVLKASWQQLLERSAEAKELNRVNGMLINKQLAHNQGLIQAMRQPAGAADTTFYGPQGQTTAVSGKRRLVVG